MRQGKQVLRVRLDTLLGKSKPRFRSSVFVDRETTAGNRVGRRTSVALLVHSLTPMYNREA